MPKGIKPKVNEAREFLEIAKDFKDPKEIIREALSNSWDAGATESSIKFSLKPILGSRAKKIVVEIEDNGQGMSDEEIKGGTRSENNLSGEGPKEIEVFFNLGDTYKTMKDAIGTKGHGTKIYYKSDGISVDTRKDGVHLRAGTEMNPWESLKRGKVPTYYYERAEGEESKSSGTRIVVDGFKAKQKDFSEISNLMKYVKWSTVMGSFSRYFQSNPRQMKLKLQSTDLPDFIEIPFGFSFPEEQLDLDAGTDSICKIFGPEVIQCGKCDLGVGPDAEPVEVTIEIIGALLGSGPRGFISDTYQQMGLWLSKDYILIDRDIKILEKSSGGQYNWAQFLLLVNCQQFDLTANRNIVRRDEAYDLALEGIKKFFNGVWNDEFTKSYFERKKIEKEEEDKKVREEREREKEGRSQQRREERLNQYKIRSDISAPDLKHPIKKEPKNEAETVLLLQSMISSGHPGIDFVIGDYSANDGVDMIIESTKKGVLVTEWAEVVSSLDKLNDWPHPVDNYHVVVCYDKGSVGEEFQIGDKSVKIISLQKKGRYTINVKDDLIRVYVLREILDAEK